MQKTITGVLIDPEKGIAEKRTLAKDLSAYYEALRCTCIDIVNRGVGSGRFDIICDDEALLKDTPWPSAVDSVGRGMLYGPIFVVKFDGSEDVTDLSDLEAEYVLSLVIEYPTRFHKEPHCVLTGVSY